MAMLGEVASSLINSVLPSRPVWSTRMGESTLGTLPGRELVAQVQRRHLVCEVQAALGELAEVVAPLALDVPDPSVERQLQRPARAVSAQAGGEDVAGVGTALSLEQVEDRAAEDHRVASRGRKARWPAVAKPRADRGAEQENLICVVLSRALDQPCPLQVAQEASRPPGRRQALVVGAEDDLHVQALGRAPQSGQRVLTRGAAIEVGAV